MAVAFVEYSYKINYPTLATSSVISKPTNLAVGQLMIAHVSSVYTGNQHNHTAPAGWTSIQQASSGWQLQTSSWWKIATTSDVSASTFSFHVYDTNSAITGTISTWTGFDTGSPIGDSNNGVNAETISTVCHSDSITPPVANCMI